MTHISVELKTVIRNNVFACICVGEAFELQEFVRY